MMKKFLYLCGAVSIVVLWFIMTIDMPFTAIQVDDHEVRMSHQLNQDTTTGPKVVARWDETAGRMDLSFGATRDPFEEWDCDVSNCIALSPDEDPDKADAIIFNTRNRDFIRQPERFRKRTRQDQIYVFYNMEAPIRTEEFLKHPNFQDAFNLTMSYRLDSDIPIKMVNILKRTEHYGPMKREKLRSKKKMAVWVISHCNKEGSPRWDYVMELAKYVDVDIYGACGNLSCPKKEAMRCFKMFEETYKFYISFENAACTDYVTEKLRWPLVHPILPIVMGGVDYAKVAPPNSVIDVRNYKSPKHLAEYLHRLDRNDDLYMEHFRWKEKLQVTGKIDPHGVCSLCAILNNSSYVYRSHFEPYRWWNMGSTCESELQMRKKLGLRKMID